MRQFKYIEQLFTSFFLQYHKDNDTYKDAQGRGILERFVLVCGEYIDEDIVKPIDDLLNLIDFEKCPDLYLKYWWEYFGFIPYAYQSMNSDTINVNPYPSANTRDILKYAIALYRIRCTHQFYEVLGRFYGVRFEFIPMNFTELADPYTKYDVKGGAFFDKHYSFDKNNCLECLKFRVNIYLPLGVFEYLATNNGWAAVYSAYILLLNKYLPPHIEILTNDDIEFLSDTAIINI